MEPQPLPLAAPAAETAVCAAWRSPASPRPLPLAEGEGAREAKPPRKRARRGAVDGDELFLPVHVRKARRQNSAHWAHEHRPCAEPPRAVKPLPWPPGTEAEDLWMLREEEKMEENRARLRRALAEALMPASCEADPEPLASGPELEIEDFELLSPEESEAKRDIWNEVNKDLLQYWDLAAQRSKQKKEEARERRRQREERQKELQRRLEQERSRRAQRLDQMRNQRRGRTGRAEQRSGEEGGAAAEEVDATIVEFWQAHSEASGLFAPAVQPAAEEEQPGWPPAVQDSAAMEAWSARMAVETAIREEEEQQRLLRRAREVAEEIDDLFNA